MDQPSQFSSPAFPPIIDEPLDRGWSLGLLAQVTVLSRFRELLNQREAVVYNQGIEGVHKIRVAARRIRTALQTFDPVWEKGKAKYFSKRFAKFAGKFGDARDFDVLGVYLGARDDGASVEQTLQYPTLAARVTKRRIAQQPKLDKAVRRLGKAGFVDEVVDYFSTHPVDLWKLGGEN